MGDFIHIQDEQEFSSIRQSSRMNLDIFSGGNVKIFDLPCGAESECRKPSGQFAPECFTGVRLISRTKNGGVKDSHSLAVSVTGNGGIAIWETGIGNGAFQTDLCMKVNGRNAAALA